jgi:hypothetical protein
MRSNEQVREQSLYWDPCHGVPPIPIRESAHFVLGQTIIAAIGLITLFFVALLGEADLLVSLVGAG